MKLPVRAMMWTGLLTLALATTSLRWAARDNPPTRSAEAALDELRVECSMGGEIKVWANGSPASVSPDGLILREDSKGHANRYARMVLRCPGDMAMGELPRVVRECLAPMPCLVPPSELVLEALDADGAVASRAELIVPRAHRHSCSSREIPELVYLESSSDGFWDFGSREGMHPKDIPGFVASCQGEVLLLEVCLHDEDRFSDWVKVAPLLRDSRARSICWTFKPREKSVYQVARPSPPAPRERIFGMGELPHSVR